MKKLEVYLWRFSEAFPDATPLLVTTASEAELPKTIRLITPLNGEALQTFYENTNATHNDLPLYAQVMLPTVTLEKQL